MEMTFWLPQAQARGGRGGGAMMAFTDWDERAMARRLSPGLLLLPVAKSRDRMGRFLSSSYPSEECSWVR